MGEDKLSEEMKPADPTGNQEIETKPPVYKGSKEKLYDKIPLSKKQLNIIIVILIVAIVVAFTLGALIGNGII
jgi:hypothetical protein